MDILTCFGDFLEANDVILLHFLKSAHIKIQWQLHQYSIRRKYTCVYVAPTQNVVLEGEESGLVSTTMGLADTIMYLTKAGMLNRALLLASPVYLMPLLGPQPLLSR